MTNVLPSTSLNLQTYAYPYALLGRILTETGILQEQYWPAGDSTKSLYGMGRHELGT